MKKFIYVAIFFIFQNFFVSNNSYKLSEFESNLNNSQQFIENGVKLTYKTDLSEDKVIKGIKTKVNEEIGYKLDEFTKAFDFDSDGIHYSFSIWNDDNTNVAIQAINTNGKYSMDEILDKVKKFNLKGFSTNVYKYAKYKVISDCSDYENQLLNVAETLQNVDLYNGSLLKAKLSDDTVISLAHMKYNSGNYIIIGTPMIFVTY